MTQRDPRPWFEAKQYGYGAGQPLTWEGWVITAAYVIAMMAIVTGLEGGSRWLAGAFVTLAIARVIAAR